MSRTIGLCCALVLWSAPVGRADVKADEWKGLKGTWTVEKAVLRGEDATDQFQSAVLTMEEGKYVVDFGGQQDKGTVTLDLTKKPRRMTVVSKEGTNQGKTFPAVYELAGDTLKVCYELEGNEPPAGLESKSGSTTLFVTYKRDKK